MTHKANEPIKAEMQCPQCLGVAELKILKVNIPGEVATLISSLQCGHCSYKDNSIHDGDIGNGTGVHITCTFEMEDDLERYMRLAENSHVVIEKHGVNFEFTCHISGIYLVESLVREIISKYYVHHYASKPLSESCSIIDYDIDKEEYIVSRIDVLDDILERPQFTMTVRDNTGISRVAPVGKMLKDIEGEDMDLFNDERVNHAPFIVAKENEEQLQSRE